MKEEIRNIVFDLGGVLVELYGEQCIAAFDRLGCEAVAAYVREHRTEDLFHRIELGLATTHEFCEEARQRTGTEASDKALTAAWNALLGDITPARRTRLQELRKAGYRLFLLSNTNDMHWQYCVERGFPVELFERVFLSYEMHLAKPDPRIFEAVLREAGIPAAETLFVDDNALNMAAAQALGIQTYQNKTIDAWLDVLQP